MQSVSYLGTKYPIKPLFLESLVVTCILESYTLNLLGRLHTILKEYDLTLPGLVGCGLVPYEFVLNL